VVKFSQGAGNDNRNCRGYLIYYPAQASSNSPAAPSPAAAARPRFRQSSLPCPTRIAPNSVFCDHRGVVDRIVVHRGPSTPSIHAPCARNGGVAARLADVTSVVAFHPFQIYSGYRATERDQTSVSHPHDSGPHCCQLGGKIPSSIARPDPRNNECRFKPYGGRSTIRSFLVF
jgi:hypothetical protein